MKTILIDDEAKALAVLESKLSRFCPEIEIVAKSQIPSEAITLIEKIKPDLVFLDITMPSMSGFQLISNIKKPNFEIIFVTAHEDYAIEAIKHSAIGYIVKPINNEELVLSVNRATKENRKFALEKNIQLIQNQQIEPPLRKLTIPVQNGFVFEKLENIIHLEGDGGYTRIHFFDRKSLLSSYNIGHYSKMLIPSGFFLTHKSHLINLSHIDEYTNEGYVKLTKKHSVPVSKLKRAEFLNRIK